MLFKPNESRSNALIVGLGLGGGLIFAVFYTVISVYFAFNVIFVIPPKFNAVLPFKEGLASVKINDYWGYIDKTGQTVIPPKFEKANSFKEGLALVKIGEEWSYINKSGQKVFKPRTEIDFGILQQNTYPSQWSISHESDSLKEGLVIRDNRKKCGYINKNGSDITKLQFNDCQPSSEGLIGVKPDRKWGYVRNPLR